MEIQILSQFSNSSELDEVRSQPEKEFDARRESEIFANALTQNNPLVAAEFDQLCAPLRDWTGGHFAVLQSQCLLWSKALHREHKKDGFSLGIKWVFYIFWPLRHGSSDGHGTNQRIICQIDAQQTTLLRKSASNANIETDRLHLKFMGFHSCEIKILPNSTSSTPFDNVYPNVPS